MAKDIYGREALDVGGAMAAESIQIKFSKEDADGLLIQNMTLQYMQPISRLFGLESRKVFFVVGRPSGTMASTHIVGLSDVMSAFYEVYGNICSLVPASGTAAGTTANNMVITINKYAGCTNSPKPTDITLGNVIVHTISLEANVGQNFVMTDAFNAEFTRMILGRAA